MARKLKKSQVKEVSSFGGVEEKGIIKDQYDWSAQTVETQSETHLEDDTGHGEAAIIRMFEFAMNPEVIKKVKPTRQDIFNSHYKGIEIALWKDGMKVLPEVNPRIVIDEKAMKYRIFVGARPMRGHILRE